MHILISDLLDGAKKNGATDENAAVNFSVSIMPKWLQWIINKLGSYRGDITPGRIENDCFVHTSTWTANPKLPKL